MAMLLEATSLKSLPVSDSIILHNNAETRMMPDAFHALKNQSLTGSIHNSHLMDRLCLYLVPIDVAASNSGLRYRGRDGDPVPRRRRSCC
jgi:hypothetical protein